MHVFRADNEDAAARVLQTLAKTGLEPTLERYGSKIYIVVKSARPDIVSLALSVGHTVRRVPNLEELGSRVTTRPTSRVPDDPLTATGTTRR